jgi:heat shock protein HslJ
MRVALPLLAATLAAACSPAPRPPGGADSTPPPSAAATPLLDTTWHLAEVGGRPVPATDDSRRPSMRLVADGRKVQGNAGCNRMMGSYELNGAALKFGPLMSTKMACPALDTEQAFLSALGSTTRYQIDGSNLTLYGADGPLARLEAGGEDPR